MSNPKTEKMRTKLVHLPEDLIRGLAEAKRRFGTPEAEVVRRAVDHWLVLTGVLEPGPGETPATTWRRVKGRMVQVQPKHRPLKRGRLRQNEK
jgi:hypothetical protein